MLCESKQICNNIEALQLIFNFKFGGSFDNLKLFESFRRFKFIKCIDLSFTIKDDISIDYLLESIIYNESMEIFNLRLDFTSIRDKSNNILLDLPYNITQFLQNSEGNSIKRLKFVGLNMCPPTSIDFPEIEE